MYFVHDLDINVAAHELQNGLDKFATWASENKLTINADKTKIMLLASKQKWKSLVVPDIFMDNIELKRVVRNRYLGVVIDESLTFKV